MPIAKSQATTISASTAETTIVTADPLCSNQLQELIVTCTQTTPAIAALTLRDATAGTTRATFDYPNSAAAAGSPLVVTFNPPLNQAVNAAWTLQASASAAGSVHHVLAVYAPL